MKLCLKCGRSFKAESKYNRLCTRCVKANRKTFVPRTIKTDLLRRWVPGLDSVQGN